MIRATTLAAVSLFALSSAALAAPDLERVRGTVESMTDSSITIMTRDGKTQEVKLDPKTAFVWVEKSSIDNIKDGKFIGTATKGENPPKALELVIFPDSMKGTAEGHYAWDSIPDQTAGGEAVKKSSMTNGTVKSSGGAMMGQKLDDQRYREVLGRRHDEQERDDQRHGEVGQVGGRRQDDRRHLR